MPFFIKRTCSETREANPLIIGGMKIIASEPVGFRGIFVRTECKQKWNVFTSDLSLTLLSERKVTAL